jgi:hypothetical protein
MATYRARMIDAVSDREGAHEFEGADDLLEDTPVRVVRSFFEHVDRSALPAGHVDWELNAAFKNRERGVVTCMGSFHFGAEQEPAPFLLMITQRA